MNNKKCIKIFKWKKRWKDLKSNKVRLEGDWLGHSLGNLKKKIL